MMRELQLFYIAFNLFFRFRVSRGIPRLTPAPFCA